MVRSGAVICVGTRKLACQAVVVVRASAVPEATVRLVCSPRELCVKVLTTPCQSVSLADAGSRAHIPTQRDRKVQRSVDPDLYRQRNLVERFFNKLKHFRRIATRFDKLARNYLAAVLLASIRLWTRNYESTT